MQSKQKGRNKMEIFYSSFTSFFTFSSTQVQLWLSNLQSKNFMSATNEKDGNGVECNKKKFKFLLNFGGRETKLPLVIIVTAGNIHIVRYVLRSFFPRKLCFLQWLFLLHFSTVRVFPVSCTRANNDCSFSTKNNVISYCFTHFELNRSMLVAKPYPSYNLSERINHGIHLCREFTLWSVFKLHITPTESSPALLAKLNLIEIKLVPTLSNREASTYPIWISFYKKLRLKELMEVITQNFETSSNENKFAKLLNDSTRKNRRDVNI